MATIELTGMVTENGELRARVPDSVKPGEVRVTIEVPDEQGIDSEKWIETELLDLLVSKPATGAEIMASGVFGAWSHRDDITDSAT